MAASRGMTWALLDKQKTSQFRKVTFGCWVDIMKYLVAEYISRVAVHVNFQRLHELSTADDGAD